MTHKEIRQKYIDFCLAHGHTLIDAASLIPDADPTLLFTVAGMQQFKEDYENPDQAPAARVVTIQPCIRTVDIDEVGDDTHLTVFDMLGYFSFGYTGQPESLTGTEPYFKETAIVMGWKFLTEEMGISSSRITATYFGGDAKRPEDSQSKEILQKIEGLSLVEATGENFWGPVGAEGACGPNVEFYVDGTEVWNNVFNQYVKDKDGNYAEAEFRGVDMGTGFERLLAVVQGKASIYQTDLFAPFLEQVKSEAHTYVEKHARVIVDHTKASLYLLADGVKPGNKGRDYVLRRLIRRAVRAAQLIGFKSFDSLLQSMVNEFGPLRPSIEQNGNALIELFLAEREKFLKTLEDGMRQLRKMMQTSDSREITGEQAFYLFESFGFPVELTQEMAEEADWSVDLTGFEEQMVKHREASRAGLEKMFQGGLADHEPKTIQHHTAHHLLLAALRKVLGSHVVQRGSNVTSDRLRIDVSHPEKISDDELRMVESIVNQKIAEDLPVINEVMDRDEALKQGALAEFGAKYPKDVSVYTIVDQDGDVYSRELCGGPHVQATGELGHFEILKEEGAGAGLRRIRARVL